MTQHTAFNMGTPAKRRKLDDSSKSSPSAPRNLDFFFGKQQQYLLLRPESSDQNIEASAKHSALTDEELARKLQAEWDQEAAGEVTQTLGTGAGDEAELSETVNNDMNGNAAQVEALEEASSHVELGTSTIETKGKNTLTLQSAASEEDTITSSVPFDESPLTFNPSQYVSELQSHWAAEGGNASYALLTRCFVLVNSTQSRIKIVDTLVNLLRVIIEGDPTSLLPTVRSSLLLRSNMYTNRCTHLVTRDFFPSQKVQISSVLLFSVLTVLLSLFWQN